VLNAGESYTFFTETRRVDCIYVAAPGRTLNTLYDSNDNVQGYMPVFRTGTLKSSWIAEGGLKIETSLGAFITVVHSAPGG
jgi:hypothetical protein